MILDEIKNADIYKSIHPEFEKVIRFIQDNDIFKMEDGRYNIDGDSIFALVQSYVTRPQVENKWEAHKKYIDIQYIAKGIEVIGWMPVDKLTLNQDYSEEKDIAFFDEVPWYSAMQLREGFFAVFFQDDAHKPCNIAKAPVEVKKVVVKVRV